MASQHNTVQVPLRLDLPHFLLSPDPDLSKSPTRDLLCPQYETCLTQAAYAGRALNCQRCKKRRREDRELFYGEQEISGCHGLSRVLFRVPETRSGGPCLASLST